jgi:pyridoxine kinase
MQKHPSILSIQSHVAYGYVGNRAAVFPLQRLGFEVSAINTVQFSNHTGYGAWRGQVFSAEHILEIVDGLRDRGVLENTQVVLSGYQGDATLGQVIVNTVSEIKQMHPKALYCCDPVIGDIGRGIFVRPGVAEFIRDHAVPLADILTPNQFELGYLTGFKIETLDDVLKACAQLHQIGPEIILVTSLDRNDAPEEVIEMLASTKSGERWLIQTPRLPVDPAPNGAGDATAALFLANYLMSGSVKNALEKATAGIFAVFQETMRAGARELQLIAAQDELVKPSRVFEAVGV